MHGWLSHFVFSVSLTNDYWHQMHADNNWIPVTKQNIKSQFYFMYLKLIGKQYDIILGSPKMFVLDSRRSEQVICIWKQVKVKSPSLCYGRFIPFVVNYPWDRNGYRWRVLPHAIITVSISLNNVTLCSTHILHMPLSLNGQMFRFHPEEILQSNLEHFQCEMSSRGGDVNNAALSEISAWVVFFIWSGWS